MSLESPIENESSEKRLLFQALDFLRQRFEHVARVAFLVAGDYGMKVELGEPGAGSFFDSKANRIQFDPLHLLDEEDASSAEFVAAHEGGHRAISRSPSALGVSETKERELYSKLGFAFGANSLEDPADNDWWSWKYSGLEPTVKRMYDKMLAEEGVVLGTPEIHAMTAALGYAPRFALFGSEIIRRWHTGRLSKNLPEDVVMALAKTEDASREYISTLPESHSKEREVITQARTRFQIFHDRVWPEMEKLVQADLSDERLRQMIEQKPQSLDQLSEDMKRELEEAMKRAREEAAQKMEDQAVDEAAKTKQASDELRKLAEALRQAGESDQANEAEGQADEKLEEAEQALKKGWTRAKRMRSEQPPQPVPLRDLSPELKEALEKIWQEMTEQEQQKMTEDAQRQLEELEDVLNLELRGKLEDRPPEMHEERHARERIEADERERLAAERKQLEKLEEELRALAQDRSAYDQAFADVKPLLDDLTDRIEHLFQPQRHPRWRSGFSSGGRLNLTRVMQYEARPEATNHLWDRKTIPEKREYNVTLLVDLSNSMSGQKIAQTFRGVIALAEALNRVGISVEILGFQDELIEFKRFDEPLDDAVRERMSGMVLEVNDRNPGGRNHSSYNDDGYCVSRAAERLKARAGKNRYLIVFSDGIPWPSSAHAGEEWELEGVVDRLSKEGLIKPIGVGLGPGTQHVKKYYRKSKVIKKVADLPTGFAELVEDVIAHPEIY